MIRMLDAPRPESTTIEFVGGPRGGGREILAERPPEIDMPDGSYKRSVRCADDDALRYVWRARGEAS